MHRPPVFQSVAFEEAWTRAQSSGRWLIVDATAVWCGPCRRMDETTWRHVDVVAWIEANGGAVQVDVDAERALSTRLEIGAMPTVIAFRGGVEKDRIVGFREAEALLGWLRGLEAGKTDLDRVRSALEDPDNDVNGRFTLAKALLSARHHDEATDEFVWLWHNMARVEPAMTGVRVSFMARDIESLVAAHVPARERFARLRDELETAAGEEARSDWIVLNQVLGDEARTLRWFDAVKDVVASANDVEQQAFSIVRLLEKHKRWADIGRIYRDPVAELRGRHEMARLAPGDNAELVQFMNESFRGGARLLIHCLRTAGRSAQAEAVAREAVELDPSDEMKQALAQSAPP